jgi:hypothetical protein
MSTTGGSAVVDALSGGFSGVLTELIFYSLDSFKVQLQAGEKIQISRLYRGALPIACCGSFPTFGVFFGIFHQCKQWFCHDGYTTHGILLSSLLAAIPSSLVGVPADVLKKRLILGSEKNILEAARAALRTNGGIKGLFLGWEANLLRDVPFAGLKLSLYEGISYLYLKYDNLQQQRGSESRRSETHELTSLEAAGIGLVCGPFTALLTNPLDCVNTRIKSGELASYNFISAHSEIVRRSGIRGLFRGLLPRTVILSLGSTVFWFWYNNIQKILLGDKDGQGGLTN